jgi:hypothetical protein
MSDHALAKEGPVTRAPAVPVIAFAVATGWLTPAPQQIRSSLKARPSPSACASIRARRRSNGWSDSTRTATTPASMEDLTFTSWGADDAEGSGTDSSVECQPNCARGTRLTKPIVVHAWNPLPPNAVGCPPSTSAI